MPTDLHPASDGEAAAAIPRCRRFGLGDAMILVAAVAIGLRITQTAFSNLWRDLRPPVDKITGRINWPQHQLSSILMYANDVMVAFLVCMSVAFLIIRLRRPRPPLRVLIRQPGVAAHEALLIANIGGRFIVQAAGLPLVGRSGSLLFGFVLVSAIPLAWVYLALSGKGCWERGWIDLLGRILGAGWTVLFIDYVVMYYV
jgi:hypothetical protein